MKKITLFLTLIICCFSINKSQGQDGFIGEIRLFAGNFTPRTWMVCDGSVLSISTYTALFSILGTTYGGDGRTTFALPDLRDRIPVGESLNVPLGTVVGTNSHTLTLNEIPLHSHQLVADQSDGDSSDPTGRFLANTKSLDTEYGQGSSTANMNSGSISSAGGSQPFDNRQASLGLKYIICVSGVFPARD